MAEFIGTANILDAERRNDQIITRAGKLTVPSPPQWKRGALVIRPEGIVLRDQEPETNGVLATITETFYRGTFLDITLEPGRAAHALRPAQEAPGGRSRSGSNCFKDALVAIDD